MDHDSDVAPGRARGKEDGMAGDLEGVVASGRLPAGSTLHIRYKGKVTRATVVREEEGTGIRVGNKIYPSPSAAAKAVMGGGSVNGWAAWRFEGEPIGALRGE
jgi:hypothetical protein